MTNTEKLPDTMFSLSKSTPDSNRFYSILLDTRASTIVRKHVRHCRKTASGEKTMPRTRWNIMVAQEKHAEPDEVNTIDLSSSIIRTKSTCFAIRKNTLKKSARTRGACSRTKKKGRRGRDDQAGNRRLHQWDKGAHASWKN